jgi:hypothetical protein
MPTLSDAQEACSLIGRAQLAAREALIMGDLSLAWLWFQNAETAARDGRDIVQQIQVEAKKGGVK